MPIYLKLVKGTGEKGEIMKLSFCMDDDEDISIDTETALKESFTTTPETLNRLNKLIEYGQMYEEIDKSHKSEFRDLELPED
ncbi:MAG: hypothetical protein JXJ04_01975 [Spirochaetales bacterium]|nr:hypothetical protein [Spirochaetales bacterium]